MAVARPVLGLVSIVLLAGGIVLQFFIILSGMHSYTTPLNQVYFIQAGLSGVKSTSTVFQTPARWTYLSLCGVGMTGLNQNCGPTHAGFPFDPVKQFGTAKGLPPSMDGHYYHVISVAAWSLYLAALFFAVFALLGSVFALCARLAAFLIGATTGMALICQSACAALMTVWVVQAKKAFIANGQTANIGVKAMAFTWATWACFFIATVLFCAGGGASKSSGVSRKQSTRSRGSFVDSESQRRVKDEYE